MFASIFAFIFAMEILWLDRYAC